MSRFQNILLYTRHISFIAFIISIIIIYPAFNKFELGTLCSVTTFIYIVITFIMFLAKNKNEETHLLNNLVILFLHIYVYSLAYNYTLFENYAITDNLDYFKLNFLILSICISALTVNKLIISQSK